MQVVSFFFPFTLFFKLTIKKERSLEPLSASSSQMDLNRKKLMINDKLEFTVAEAGIKRILRKTTSIMPYKT